MKRFVLLISLLYFVLDENYSLAYIQANGFGNRTYRIVMVRHGESEWNQKNLFTGWYNTKLSPKGIEEAIRAGKTLKETKYEFDVAHVSMLKRTEETMYYIKKELGQNITVFKSWRLNERHYGSLTGLNKAETVAKYGLEKVTIWRRSYDIPPPAMESDHPYYKQILEDPRYDKEDPLDCDFPIYESLKQTIKRTLPYWKHIIVPQMLRGRNILIVAHGNSLRGIIKHLENITDTGIVDVNLPTGIPFEYTLDENIKPVYPKKFLGDKEILKKALQSMTNSLKGKKT